jgi:asparagine synthase (glutamine-hydrolysing)
VCGIAAVIGAPEIPEAHGLAARDTMFHRGPDDGGIFQEPGVWLASRRLAIQDLSPAGHQPFHDEEAGVSVVFNGEIYNYLELRRELVALGHRFHTGCDTEVLLRAYLEWGKAFVLRCNGMWAFVVWDRREGRAFYCRDRFGVKPLFIAQLDGAVALASEPKALCALYPALRVPDELSVAALLAQKRVYHSERSFYRSIKVVPSAHWGTFAPGDRTPSTFRYWSPPDQCDAGEVSWSDAVDQFSSLFEDAVQIRLRSDVPVGVTLSGGLDSTAVYHAARTGAPGAPDLTAYTSVYDGGPRGQTYGELRWAQLAAGSYPGGTLREVIAKQDGWESTLLRIVSHMDGPGFSPAVFPLWNIMASARADGVTVLLEGQGADELLGGYSWHAAEALRAKVMDILRARDRRAARELLAALRLVFRSYSARRVVADLLVATIPALARVDRRRATLLDVIEPDLLTACGDAGDPTAWSQGWHDALSRRCMQDFLTDLLPGFLHYGDAVSMAHSIESRLPFLDYRVVELCMRMPGRYKFRGGESKAPLRAYLRASGQGQIASRRRKQGFPTPTNEWLASDGADFMRDLLLDPHAAVRPYVVAAPLERAIARHADGSYAAGDTLFALVCTELWLKECIAGTATVAPRMPVVSESA